MGGGGGEASPGQGPIALASAGGKQEGSRKGRCSCHPSRALFFLLVLWWRLNVAGHLGSLRKEVEPAVLPIPLHFLLFLLSLPRAPLSFPILRASFCYSFLAGWLAKKVSQVFSVSIHLNFLFIPEGFFFFLLDLEFWLENLNCFNTLNATPRLLSWCG